MLSLVSESKLTEAVLSDGLPPGSGRLVDKVQQVFDPRTQRLERRRFLVYDLSPQLGREPIWQPADIAADRPGPVSGSGTLTWRERGRPAWDPAGVTSSYTGELRDGRLHGKGRLVGRDGTVYEGEWRHGRAHGEGRLQLAGADEFAGRFVRGHAEGLGLLVDATGERFEGTFATGRRHGRGTTTLPSGASYQSRWTNGVEDPASHRVRLAQLGPSPGGEPRDDLRLAVTVRRVPPLPPNMKVEQIIGYASSARGDTIIVQPASAKLMNAWKGSGEIQAETYDGEIKWGTFGLNQRYLNISAPTFSIELQNRSSVPVEIVGFRLDVARGRLDPQPAMQMTGLLDTQCGGSFHADYQVENHGWSPALNARLRLSFSPVSSGSRSGSPTTTKALGSIAEDREMNLEPELAAAGVSVSQLKALGMRGFACPRNDRNACLQPLKSDRRFGRLAPMLGLEGNMLVVRAAGFLDYEWRDGQGAERQRSSPFNILVSLGRLQEMAECGEGGTPEPVRVNPVRFRLNADDYALPVPFRRTVNAGQSASFTLPVDAEKSSSHEFRITALLANGRTLQSRPISLLYFRPRPTKETN